MHASMPTHSLLHCASTPRVANKNMKKLISILIVFAGLVESSGQVNDDSIRLIVLRKAIVDSLYVFGSWDDEGGTETHLRYLGVIRTDECNYKIMTSCWIWGLSSRATNRLLIFNERNEYIGNYYLTTRDDLPEKIESNNLVFINSEDDNCDKRVVTKLSFENGVPKEFFLECRPGIGSFYSFSEEE